ncbi:alpha-1,2-fucosyltransferase [Piscinibacter sp. HJYY11]|uniref:alpha-1,2-fucosyltransferase n=1 Tax=Piscinibacter sp. HJYY11 TaxID=2801333 RepID=UPI0019203234|nr:alpha-1,2-fucosyltransferase [Piscinibacter sp. HJYY11]MBL0727922.1 alpha-1,2-fucosyltransferase [Piscinibacter sp. HJYY11]
MIISNLLGGLGNQMFQYACGRAMSLRQHTEFKVAIDMFAGYTLHHGYELPRVFNLTPPLASRDDLRLLLGWQHSRGVRRVVAKLRWKALASRAFCFEPHLDYWPGLAAHGPDAYLHGYFQSERYFADATTQIRSDFTFSTALAGRNAAVAERIVTSNSVSMHLRRGDYVSDKRNAGLFAVCDPDYYRAAMALLLTKHPEASFFVFSDDATYAHELFGSMGAHVQIVSHNTGEDSHNDMRLMSLCRHHVIANSTFSWWGAWLDARPDKLVIAPRRWYGGDMQPADLIPSSWVRL